MTTAGLIVLPMLNSGFLILAAATGLTVSAGSAVSTLPSASGIEPRPLDPGATLDAAEAESMD